MKKVIIIVLLFTASYISLRADDTRYIKAMKSNISQIDSMKTLESMIDLTNAFKRISGAEKNKWLPNYYTAYMLIISSFADTVKSKKDGYLDEAVKYLSLADSLQPNDSEIYVLKAMVLQARLQVDPMSRFMKYGMEMNGNLQKAVLLDPKNPRPEYLLGVNTFYTPEQFGGGPKSAKPILENSRKKFDEFVPKDELMPNWGKQQVEYFIKQLPKDLK